MSKDTMKEIPKELPQATEPAISLPLHDFCLRLSETEERVELIGGFEADERFNGRKKDTAENFAARFHAFVSKPA